MTSACQIYQDGPARYWPFAVAGLLGPIVSDALTPPVPMYSAAAGSFFVLFFAAFWLFDRHGARPTRHRFGRSLAASATGAAAVGLLTYLVR